MGRRADRRRRRKERRQSQGRAKIWQIARKVYRDGDTDDDLRDKVAQELSLGGGDMTFFT